MRRRSVERRCDPAADSAASLSASQHPSIRLAIVSTLVVPRTSDTIRSSSTRGTPEGQQRGVAALPPERLVLTYSSRIYLERRKPGDRTAPSRYFPFYDSSTYDAFKPAGEEELHVTPGRSNPRFPKTPPASGS